MDPKATKKFGLDSYKFELLSNKPKYTEMYDSKNGIVTWGDDNNYPEYLLNLLNKSGKHNSIVKGKSQFIGGNGFDRTGLSKKAINWLNNEYNEEDMDEILAKIAYDNEIFGCYALNVIWSKDREFISRVSYIPVNKLRIEKNPSEGRQYYYLSDDWSNYSRTPKIKYPAFDPNDREEASTIYLVQEYRPGNQFYTIPEYISASKWIELEFEISQFHLKNIQNSFAPSMLLSFNSGVPSPDEMEENNRALKRTYEGAMNAGSVIITYAESAANAPTITPIESNNTDDRFTRLNQDVEDGIFQGHRVTNPALFGVKTPGQLGNSKEYTDSIRAFQSMYSLPKQKSISKIFTYLASFNGINDIIMPAPYTLETPKETSITELMSVLTSPLPPETKFQVLLAAGYGKDVSKKLIGQ